MDAWGQSGAAQRAGASGIAGLGQQGYNMLTGQINTLGGLGATGRGIQDRGFANQYRAATQMADEPWMRMQRGMQLLGQGSVFLPQYQTGFGTASQAMGQYQQPYTFAQGMNAAAQIGSLFNNRQSNQGP